MMYTGGPLPPSAWTSQIMSFSRCLKFSSVWRAATRFKVDQSNCRPSSLSTNPMKKSLTVRGSLNSRRREPS